MKLLIGKLAGNVDDDRRAQFILQMATIVALVESGAVSIAAVAENIAAVQAALAPKYKGPRIDRHLETAVRFLLDYGAARRGAARRGAAPAVQSGNGSAADGGSSGDFGPDVAAGAAAGRASGEVLP